MDMPEGMKAFSKTKPIRLDHFNPVREWWDNRVEIQDDDGNFKSKRYSREELAATNYDLDLCGYPHKVEDVLEPDVLINQYFEKKASLDASIKDVLGKIMALLEKDE
jgi:type I restriction enzyme M protein